MDRYIGLDAHASSCTVATVGPKSDKLDAFGLAEQLRIGAIKRKVYKKRGEFGALRHRAKAYTLLVSDSVRVQNRIKSLFRSRGVAVAGKSVFRATEREAWLEKLPATAPPGPQSTLGWIHIRTTVNCSPRLPSESRVFYLQDSPVRIR